MTMVLTVSERYKKPEDIIEYAKKYGAYDFYVALNPGQADKWIKTVEKAFNTLWLSDKEKMNNVYGLMFDKVDDWLARIKNLFSETLIW